MVNLLRIYYELVLEKKGRTTEDWAKELGTTTEEGTNDGFFVTLLKENKIPCHEEVECSPQRFVSILNKLPEKIMMLINIWDMRLPRPGYSVTTDPPECHNLWLLKVGTIMGRQYVTVFDPDTYFGGVKQININTLFEIWHDGPGSVSGAVSRGGTFAGQQNIRWFVLIGMDTNQVIRLAGIPEYENKIRLAERLVVPESGRLVVPRTRLKFF